MMNMMWLARTKPRRALSLAVVLLSLAGAQGLLQSAVSPEYRVKAGYLVSFPRFIVWPIGKQTVLPVVVGVLGVDPFGPTLDRLAKAETAAGRPLVVLRLNTLQDIPRCKLLFVSASEKGKLSTVLEAAQRASVVTVGDMDGFLDSGGMINLVMQRDRVHFEINLDVAKRANLRFSSRLLDLATVVRTRAARKQ